MAAPAGSNPDNLVFPVNKMKRKRTVNCRSYLSHLPSIILLVVHCQTHSDALVCSSWCFTILFYTTRVHNNNNKRGLAKSVAGLLYEYRCRSPTSHTRLRYGWSWADSQRKSVLRNVLSQAWQCISDTLHMFVFIIIWRYRYTVVHSISLCLLLGRFLLKRAGKSLEHLSSVWYWNHCTKHVQQRTRKRDPSPL